MAVVKDLIRAEADGTLSFGDFTLGQKTKLDGFEFLGNVYKVKTFSEITKLERDGMFVYESVPGTAALNFKASAEGLVFKVSGDKDAQITVGLEADSEYEVTMDGNSIGVIKTNLSGKLSISAELEPDKIIGIEIVKK